jgi:hypothetical protein
LGPVNAGHAGTVALSRGRENIDLVQWPKTFSLPDDGVNARRLRGLTQTRFGEIGGVCISRGLAPHDAHARTQSLRQ